MRAEHDRVDEAAARRRLGNMLHTRESMRRVWIAEWWDALRQDAHFTWRSWRRRPGFALGAILVLALGLGASTALFAALDRVLFRPLPYADPDRLVSVGTDHRPARVRRPDRDDLDRHVLRAGVGHAAAPFRVGDGDLGGAGRARSPRNSRRSAVPPRRAQLPARAGRARRRWAATSRPRTTCAGRRRSHSSAMRCGCGASARIRSRRSDAESRQTKDRSSAGPHHRRPAAGLRDAARNRRHPAPAQMRPARYEDRSITSLTALGTPQAGRDTRAREADAGAAGGRGPAVPAPACGLPVDWRVRPLRDRRVGDAARVAWLLIGAVAVFLLIACVNVTNLMLARVAERRGSSRSEPPSAPAGCASRAWRSPRACCSRSRLAASGCSLPSRSCGRSSRWRRRAFRASRMRRSTCACSSWPRCWSSVTGMAIGVWPAISVFRAGALHGLRSTTTSSPGARPRVRFALVTTQIALTLALLGGSALLLRSLWNVVNVPLGFDAERVVTLTAGLSRTRYPTPSTGRRVLRRAARTRARMPGAVSAALSNAPPPPRPDRDARDVEVEGRPVESRAPQPPIRIAIGDAAVLRDLPHPGGRRADVLRTPIGRRAGRRAQRVRRADPVGGSARSDGAFSPAVSRTGNTRDQWYTVVGVTRGRSKRGDLTDEPNPEIYLLARPGRWVDCSGPPPFSRFARRRSCRCGRLPSADRRRSRSRAARDHRDSSTSRSRGSPRGRASSRGC